MCGAHTLVNSPLQKMLLPVVPSSASRLAPDVKGCCDCASCPVMLCLPPYCLLCCCIQAPLAPGMPCCMKALRKHDVRGFGCMQMLQTTHSSVLSTGHEQDGPIAIIQWKGNRRACCCSRSTAARTAARSHRLLAAAERHAVNATVSLAASTRYSTTRSFAFTAASRFARCAHCANARVRLRRSRRPVACLSLPRRSVLCCACARQKCKQLRNTVPCRLATARSRSALLCCLCKKWLRHATHMQESMRRQSLIWKPLMILLSCRRKAAIACHSCSAVLRVVLRECARPHATRLRCSALLPASSRHTASTCTYAEAAWHACRKPDALCVQFCPRESSATT